MDVYIDTHMCEQCMKNNSSVTYTFNYLMSTIESVSKHTHRIIYVCIYIYIYICMYVCTYLSTYLYLLTYTPFMFERACAFSCLGGRRLAQG